MMEIRLPSEKLMRLKTMISSWALKKARTKCEPLSLIGHLSHACQVIKPGRPFLRRLIELSTKVRKLQYHLRLNVATRSDLGWWKFFFNTWNGEVPADDTPTQMREPRDRACALTRAN